MNNALTWGRFIDWVQERCDAEHTDLFWSEVREEVLPRLKRVGRYRSRVLRLGARWTKRQVTANLAVEYNGGVPIRVTLLDGDDRPVQELDLAALPDEWRTQL